MHLDITDLLILWLGGGFVLGLAWATVMGHALLDIPARGVKPAVFALALVGLINPVGALAALDTVVLARTIEDPTIPLPRWALPATQVALAVSLVIALWLGLHAEGSL